MTRANCPISRFYLSKLVSLLCTVPNRWRRTFFYTEVSHVQIECIMWNYHVLKDRFLQTVNISAKVGSPYLEAFFPPKFCSVICTVSTMTYSQRVLEKFTSRLFRLRFSITSESRGKEVLRRNTLNTIERDIPLLFYRAAAIHRTLDVDIPIFASGLTRPLR
jgi:hypothetical protein